MKNETKIFISRSPQETFDCAEQLGETLQGGEFIRLEGGLGAGKTVFTKGVLHALGFDADEVNSPSFTLVNLYKTPRFDVFHIDLWRLENVADTGAAVGLPEILEDKNAVVIVEWSERLKNFEFPPKTIRVRLKGDGEDERRIEIDV